MTDYQKLQTASFVPLSRGWGVRVERRHSFPQVTVTLTYQGEGVTYAHSNNVGSAVLLLCADVLRLCAVVERAAGAIPPTWSCPSDEIAALGVEALGELSAKGKEVAE